MKQEEAINILIQAVNLGQSKGAYALQDAAIIAQAVQALTPKEPFSEPAQFENLKEH
jgi:hypothetical protein